MWGKRHSRRLLDILRDEAERKRSWDTNRVRMWGKRGGYYDSDHVGYDWLDQDPDVSQHAYPKRESKFPSSFDDGGQMIPQGLGLGQIRLLLGFLD